MNQINEMKLTLPAKSQNEAFARSTVAAFFAQINPTVEQINDVKTAVSEAVTNSIVHGYSNADGTIDVICKLFENEIQIEINDYGKGIENVPQAMQPFYTTVNTGDRSGMGFTVMQAFCDDVTVTSSVNNGTSVKLKKVIK